MPTDFPTLTTPWLSEPPEEPVEPKGEGSREHPVQPKPKR